MKKGRDGMRQLNTKPNVMVCLAAILFLFVGISTYFVTGLYAKYTSNGTGSDDARVAAFEVHAVEVEGKDLSMDLGDVAPMAIFAFEAQNKSEVAVRCDVSITFNDALLAGVGIVLSDDKIADSSDMEFTIALDDCRSALLEDAIDLAVGSQSTKYIIFTPSDGTYAVLGNGKNYTSSNTIKIGVVFEQID